MIKNHTKNTNFRLKTGYFYDTTFILITSFTKKVL